MEIAGTLGYTWDVTSPSPVPAASMSAGYIYLHADISGHSNNPIRVLGDPTVTYSDDTGQYNAVVSKGWQPPTVMVGMDSSTVQGVWCAAPPPGGPSLTGKAGTVTFRAMDVAGNVSEITVPVRSFTG